jgi:hypothetical protein
MVGRMGRWHLAETDYPAVRRVMGPDRMQLDDDALEVLLERTFPDADPEDVEDFMRTVQQFSRQVAPLAQRVLPGAAQGAVQGATVAGPWGALAGGVIGGVSSLIGGGARPRPAGPPAAAGGAPPQPAPAPIAPPPPGAPPALAPAGGAPGALPPVAGAPAPAATAQLLGLLSRPETMQALLAMLMSASGRPAVAVGQRQVPPAAFANAIAELAAVAAAEDGPLPGDAAAEHLYDPDGRPRGDIANPAARAAILLSELAEVAAEEAAAADMMAEEEEESDEEDEESLPDQAEEDPVDAYERSASGWTADV